jgi:oligo-1,6-glucosidase
MDRKWWKESIAYQAYVRSFKDSNGDGIGDLVGLTSKLDYLKDLGIDILYLSPINTSPNYDNGYDISNFEDIMLEFGTLDDFDNLVVELHKRNMKLIMDIVINHTSHEHPWFLESKKSKDNPYRDYYIWQPGRNGGPPNNWGSFFGGSAWEYDDNSDEYYLHIFSKQQPDLNWKCAKLREDIKKMIRFWINRGVDGFRMDAVNHLAKDLSFPDAEIEDGKVYGNFIRYVQNLPEVHDYIREIREAVFDDNYHVIIGETGGISYHNASIYTGINRKELDMTFHFDMNGIGFGKNPWEKKPIDLISDIKEKMSGWQKRDDSEGWCPLFYSNHDSTRTVSRLGNDKEYWKESAKMLALLQLTQKGTPFIYYGDEIGMTNAEEFSLEDYRDIAVANRHKEFVETNMVSEEHFLIGLHNTSRDNARTPMQWNNSPNSGFSSVKPWIKVNSNYKDINVEKQLHDNDSIINFYKSLIAIRKAHPAFIYGSFCELNNEHKEVYSYLRELEGESFLILINFFGKPAAYKIPHKVVMKNAELLICNYKVEDEIDPNFNDRLELKLRAYESRIYLLKNQP